MSTAPSSPSSSDIFRQFVDRAQRLHTLPAVALQILDLTADEDVDLREIRKCIESDPALTSKILRTANSSIFGLNREVGDLEQALAILGLTPLKMLVLGFSLPTNLFDNLSPQLLQDYWRHTLIRAVAARRLASDFFEIAGEQAYIAGLLYGLGQLVLIRELGESYAGFLERVRNEDADLAEMEIATLGFDHATLTSRMLDHWGFPHNVVDAIGQPFDEAVILALPPQHRELSQVLHLAELIARLLTGSRPSILSQLLRVAARYRELPEGKITDVVRSLAEEVPQLAQIYSLKIEDDYEAVLLTAHEQLAHISESAAEELIRHRAATGESDPELRQAAVAATSRQGPTEHSVASEPAAEVRDALNSGAAVAELTRASDSGARIVTLERPLESAISLCRDLRAPLSLVLIELAQVDDLVFQLGPARFERLVNQLADAVQTVLTSEQLLRVGDARFAILLHEFDRAEAVSFSRSTLKSLPVELKTAPTRIAVGIGVATLSCPPYNFPGRELVDAAERCLNGAHQSGGGTVKSIDL